MADGSANGEGDADTKFLLDVLFDHNMVWVQGLLREKDLPAGGLKSALRTRVQGFIEDGSVETTELIALLDRIEGWGNQHTYLYLASDNLIAELADEKQFKDRLRELHQVRLFNRRVPLILPNEPTISAIEWSQERVRFIWVEKRLYRDPRDDKSYSDGILGGLQSETQLNPHIGVGAVR